MRWVERVALFAFGFVVACWVLAFVAISEALSWGKAT